MALRMIGTKKVVYDDHSVKIMFAARAKDGIKSFRICLDPSDTYTVTFYGQVRMGQLPVKAIFEDVYCDNLVDVIESTTGLYLHF